MNKSEFINRMSFAAEMARKLALSLDYIDVDLPEEYLFSLQEYDDQKGARGPEGTIKFLGGRFLRPEELKHIPLSRAGPLLWVNGFVPAWVNIGVSTCSSIHTEFDVMFCRTLVDADVSILQPDLNMTPGNNLVPFRIRGPNIAGWRIREGNT